MEKLKQFWQDLNQREQYMVTSCVIIVMIFLFYTLCWRPLANTITTRQKLVLEQQELLSWMQKSVATIKQASLNHANSTSSEKELLVGINSTLTSFQFKAEVSPGVDSSDNKVTLHFNNVSVDEWLNWLVAVKQQFGVNIESVDITRLPAAGMAEIKLTLNI